MVLSLSALQGSISPEPALGPVELYDSSGDEGVCEWDVLGRYGIYQQPWLVSLYMYMYLCYLYYFQCM